MSLIQGVIIMGVFSSIILSKSLNKSEYDDLSDYADLVRAISHRNRYFLSTTASDYFYEQARFF